VQVQGSGTSCMNLHHIFDARNLCTFLLPDLERWCPYYTLSLPVEHSPLTICIWCCLPPSALNLAVHAFSYDLLLQMIFGHSLLLWLCNVLCSALWQCCHQFTACVQATSSILSFLLVQHRLLVIFTRVFVRYIDWPVHGICWWNILSLWTPV